LERSSKDSNLSSILANKPLNKEPVSKLKKSMEPFLQDGSCTDITPKLTKCRECKMPPNQRNKKIANANIFCRFYAFRRWV
jgi:lysine-specific demethylase 3